MMISIQIKTRKETDEHREEMKTFFSEQKIEILQESQKVCTDRDFFCSFSGNIGPMTSFAVVLTGRPDTSSARLRSLNRFKLVFAPDPELRPRSGLRPSSSESAPKLVMNSTFPLFSGLGDRLLEYRDL